MRWLHVFAVLALLSLAAPSRSQIGAGEVGFLIMTRAGNVGTICTRNFSCTPLSATALRGEQTTLVVRGVQHRPFVVMAGLPNQLLCLPFPGIHNSLIVPPIFLPFVGTLTRPDGILACPGGVEQMLLTIPQELPPGSSFALQALAWSYLLPAGETPTFTTAIQVRVQ